MLEGMHKHQKMRATISIELFAASPIDGARSALEAIKLLEEIPVVVIDDQGLEHHIQIVN